eukprot:TRINITY_DN13330_c0_g1_i1.p1 TRINITY_DN13330_c0_g1~~TRINITY_DN13330_c0_g1_i1.p1  ORF type:complete len:159 (-),score=33.60 TRINITY_DN13330_c0_g1_i1:117-593(-)
MASSERELRTRSRIADYGCKTDKYEWDQTKEEVTIWVPLGEGLSGRDVVCKITSRRLIVGVKGKPPVIDGDLGAKVIVDESTWTLVDGSAVDIVLQKASKGEENWWKSAIVGEAEIDTDLIEGSKYLDDSLLRKVKEQKEAKRREEEASRKAQQATSQ